MQTITYDINKSTWLPESIKEAIRKNGGKLTYQTGFTRPERKIFRRQNPVKPSEWSERHRVLTMSSLPGPWKNRVTPYLVGIMDAMGYKSVREVDICKAPQTGVSEAAHNFVGWCIDRYPGPVLYCYPDEMTARENSKDRVLPMIKSSIKLRSYMTGVMDDTAVLRINMQHMPIYFAWATSPSRLGNKPIKIAIADEVDKYPATLHKEAGSLGLLDKRLNTYRRNSKFIRISTPTIETGNIWTGYQSCQAKFNFYVKCPMCGASQKMIFEQIKWPKDNRNGQEVREKKLAWYECNTCKAKWNDSIRDEAVLNGDWLTVSEPRLSLEKYMETYNPPRVGFHLPAYISPFVSLSETAAAFLDCLLGNGHTDREKHKDFCNNYKAEPHMTRSTDRAEDYVLSLRDDRPRGMVPGGNLVAGMTASVDTQDNGFWYEIRAVGFGHVGTSWCVREGFIPADWRNVELGDIKGRSSQYHPAFDALVRVLWEDTYQDSSGNVYNVEMTLIDSAGHKTTEVYDFCRSYRGRILAIRGEQKMQTSFKFSIIDTYPGTNKPIPGGVRLGRLHTGYYKGKLSSLLDISPADPGAFLFHAEFEFQHARHYTAEYEDEKGIWQCLPGRDNHLWDCSVYNLVAAEMLGIRYRSKRPEAGKVGNKSKQKTSEDAKINPYTKGNNPIATARG